MRSGLLLLPLFAWLLAPLTVLGAGKNSNLLADYFAALSNRDLARLELLLGQEFQYSYVQGITRITLNRDEELRSVRKLLQEANIQIEQYLRDVKRIDRSHVKFNIHFKESSKDLNSFFFSSALAMNETLMVVVKDDKIVKIVEDRGKASNTLSFGSLKSIFSKNTVIESTDTEPEATFRLIDSVGRQLLLVKKVRNRGTYFETAYYLPGDKKIRNVLY